MDSLSAKLTKLQMQGKDSGDDSEDEGGAELSALTAFELARNKALQKLDAEEFDALQVEYQKERTALEAKYIGLRQPLYEQRAKIISGAVPVPPLEEGEGPAPAPGRSRLHFVFEF